MSDCKMYVEMRDGIPSGYRYGESRVVMQLHMEGGFATEEEAYREWLRFEGIEIRECREGGYVLKDTNCPGCITQAETIAEGVRMIQDAREAWEEARGL